VASEILGSILLSDRHHSLSTDDFPALKIISNDTIPTNERNKSITGYKFSLGFIIMQIILIKCTITPSNQIMP
jgi:hypothetical protein